MATTSASLDHALPGATAATAPGPASALAGNRPLSIRPFFEDKAAAFVASKVVKSFDSQVDPGVYRLQPP